MLNNCSSATFILDDISNQLGVHGTKTTLKIRTINGPKLQESNVIQNLKITSLDEKETINIPRAYTKDEIPAVSREEIPTSEMARRWNHLKEIANKIPPLISDAVVGVLIGTDVPQAIKPRDVRCSQDGGPFAQCTFAGWTIIGPLKSPMERSDACCQRITAKKLSTECSLDYQFILKIVSKK